MKQYLGLVAVVVRDYDEAIAWYTEKLGFVLTADTAQDNGKRWVTVAPPGARESGLLLAQAANPAQAEHIGNQTGGRVFLFLNTADFARDYQAMTARGVQFLEAPRRESYGTVAVFTDLYGNKWDFIEPQKAS